MRSRYHPIEDGLWDDEKFDALGGLPAAGFIERALFVYLCANHRQRPSGIYRATDAQLSAGSRLSEEEVKSHLESMASRGLIVRDGSWLFVPGYLKRQAKHDRLMGAVQSQVRTCGSSIILVSFLRHYPLLHRMLPDGYRTVSQRSTEGQETVNRLCNESVHSEAVSEAVSERTSEPSVGSHSDEMRKTVPSETESPKTTEPAGGALQRIETDTLTKNVTKETDNHRGPLSSVASPAQALRLKLLDERHHPMPQRDKFGIWPAAQRLYSAGLPLDTATSILNAMVSRWETILHPWAYLQAVLDREYREYHIQVQLADHEATKKLPANVELIGEVMRRAAQPGGTTDAGDRPDAEPWS